MTLERILRKHARPRVVLGHETAKRALMADLKAHRKFQTRLYTIIFTIVCLLALMMVGAVVADLITSEGKRHALLAGAGITTPVILEWMRRVVREWSQTNLLIILVGHSDEGAIQSLIENLLSGQAAGLASGAKPEGGS